MPIDDALKNLEPAVKKTPVVKNSKKGAKNNEDDLPTVDADAQSDPDDEIDVKDIPF